jgi:two-component system sensor histidine kinase YesM
MEYVRSYLVLQQFRYEDCLSVSITIPDTVAELYIPRFTLQPLVENAIKHGMISPDDPFAIDLEIFIREHTLHIRIGNDGTRISLEQMKKLLDFDASRQELLDFDQKSYGVQNIQRRIQILCGISYGLSYEIRNNRTWCDLTLPVLEHDPSEKTEDLQ